MEEVWRAGLQGRGALPAKVEFAYEGAGEVDQDALIDAVKPDGLTGQSARYLPGASV